MSDSAKAPALALFAAEPSRVKRTSAADEVIATIKAMIIDGGLKPYQRMPSEYGLATALRVSRPTIREATRALVALNILEARHGDGTYVTSLAPELLAEPIDFLLRVDKDNLKLLTETREALETGIVALAAARATEDDVAMLRTTVEEYSAALSSVSRCIDLDRRFHQQLTETARSPILAGMLSTISMLAAKSRQTTARSAAIRRRSDTDHRGILDAIECHEPERARQEMAVHLRHVAPLQG